MAVANVIGKEDREMIHLMLAGKIDQAREIHYKTLPVVRALFIESNPAPAKRVQFGLQSWDEMFIGFFDAADDPPTVSGQVAARKLSPAGKATD